MIFMAGMGQGNATSAVALKQFILLVGNGFEQILIGIEYIVRSSVN